MKPNQSGGHTFEAGELSAVTNILYQASFLLNAVSPDIANAGKSPAYKRLSRQFGWMGAEHNSLAELIDGMRSDIDKLDEGADYPTKIGETQAIMVCLQWANECPQDLQPLVTSAEQRDKAQEMVAQFIGQPLTAQAVTP